ncbi:large subunit of alpha-aminoadipate reductase [Neonectria punicea]|uniref:Large subunit of alpha-aminoadipate reductase n=1 Tax=Neonectria punicea TaxID=979145 RepID=A0ABR1HLL0_9HYPO
MNEYLSALKYYGYKILQVTHDEWKDELENCVPAGGQEKDQEQHALIPPYRFCVYDLLANTPAPELDDRSIVNILKDDVGNWTGVEESSGYRITCVGDLFLNLAPSTPRRLVAEKTLAAKES